MFSNCISDYSKKVITVILISISPPAIKKKVASHHQHFLCSLSQNFHGPQNILLYEYLNMQYVKRKKQASPFKQQQNTFYSSFMHSFLLLTLECGQVNNNNEKQYFEQKLRK